jgi:nucleoside-diphosphate-sugar epimerase
MTRPLVIGATGMVGGMILRRLTEAGARPVGLSRHPPADAESADWIAADLTDMRKAELPPLKDVFATAPAPKLARAIPYLAAAGATRLVAFTSTSLETKKDTPDADEREMIRRWAQGERDVIAECERHGIAWTVLRPTLIYAEGLDENVSRIAGLIRRFRFFPLAGDGKGLRQPVHADDLAAAAIAAASREQCHGRIYDLSGGEILPYREMVGRIFDGLDMPRRVVPVPAWLWRAGLPFALPFFPGLKGTMVGRMAKDMTFDSTAAAQDIGWSPRVFRPRFR